MAARLLARLALHLHHDGHLTELHVLAVGRSLLALRGLCRRRATKPLAIMAAAPVILFGRGLLRASPTWQRRAAYATLYVTPKIA